MTAHHSGINTPVISVRVEDRADPLCPGLILRTKDGVGESWYLRIQIHGKRFYRPLGELSIISREEARERARLMKSFLQDCFNVHLDLGAELFLQTHPMTIAEIWQEWVKSERATGTSTNSKTYDDMLARGHLHVHPFIGSLYPADVEPCDIAEILNHAYERLSESTVKKIRQDMNRFFSWLRAKKLLKSDAVLPTDPGFLEVLVKKKARRKISTPHPALSQRDLPRFVRLLTREGVLRKPGVLAILFALLTASRIGNVIGSLDKNCTAPMCWSNLDFRRKLWIIPANNMKSGRHNGEHVVPLSDQACAILRLQRSWQQTRNIQPDWVFTTSLGTRFDYRRLPKLLSELSQIDKLEGHNGFIDRESGLLMHLHGLRSTFKTWGTDHGIDWTLTEISLHHNIDKLKYDRAKAILRRRKIMQQWADFCFGQTASNWQERAVDEITSEL